MKTATEQYIVVAGRSKWFEENRESLPSNWEDLGDSGTGIHTGIGSVRDSSLNPSLLEQSPDVLGVCYFQTEELARSVGKSISEQTA